MAAKEKGGRGRAGKRGGVRGEEKMEGEGEEVEGRGGRERAGEGKGEAREDGEGKGRDKGRGVYPPTIMALSPSFFTSAPFSAPPFPRHSTFPPFSSHIPSHSPSLFSHSIPS